MAALEALNAHARARGLALAAAAGLLARARTDAAPDAVAEPRDEEADMVRLLTDKLGARQINR